MQFLDVNIASIFAHEDDSKREKFRSCRYLQLSYNVFSTLSSYEIVAIFQDVLAKESIFFSSLDRNMASNISA
jgi:hypothetical protein